MGCAVNGGLLMKVLDYRLQSEAFGGRKAKLAKALPTVPLFVSGEDAHRRSPAQGGDLTRG